MEDKKISPESRFWRLLKPDKREIRNIYVYAVFNGLINLSLPLGIQAIVNFIQGGRVSTSWIVLVSIVVLGIGATGVLQIFQLRITETLQQKIFTRAALEFSYRIPRIKMEAIYKHYAPELMNRFFDTMSVQKGLAKIIVDFSSAILQVTFGLILLSLYHPFFILFSAVLSFLIYIIFRVTWKKGLETSLDESKEKYKVAHWLEELARTHITFKLAGSTDLPMKNADKKISKYITERENHFKILVKQYSGMVLFKVLVAIGLLAIGGMLVMSQQMNIGQFVAAEIIILLIMASVEKLVLNLETIYDVLTSLEKIGQVTDLDLESDIGFPLDQDGQGMEINLEKVNFNYPGTTFKSLRQVSLNINPGERILLAGGNGSGKTTLLYILAGLYEINDGLLQFNGKSWRTLNLESLRSSIGDFLSHEQLFEASIQENITMGREDITEENLRWAITNLKLESFINSQDQGLNTMVDPEGKRFSGSVIQKLLLARAIADKPKLLLLDEALEQIREDERLEIIDFLVDPSNPWTLVSTSASIYLAKQAHKIVVMHEGSVYKVGDYESTKQYLTHNRTPNA